MSTRIARSARSQAMLDFVACLNLIWVAISFLKEAALVRSDSSGSSVLTATFQVGIQL